MKKLLLSIITASSITISVNAQQAEPIFTIDNKLEVYADEFWRDYKQHSNSEPEDLKQLIDLMNEPMTKDFGYSNVIDEQNCNMHMMI